MNFKISFFSSSNQALSSINSDYTFFVSEVYNERMFYAVKLHNVNVYC